MLYRNTRWREECPTNREDESDLVTNAIINHLHRGILYHDELPGPLNKRQQLKAYIKKKSGRTRKLISHCIVRAMNRLIVFPKRSWIV